MYFWTVLVIFLTSTCSCYMQPYQIPLNSGATKIFPSGKLRRGHHSSTPNTSVHILKKGTGNNVLKKSSQFQKLAASGTNDQFSPEHGTPPLQPTDMYVPFDYQYTKKTEEFVGSSTKDFYAYLTGGTQMIIVFFLSNYYQKKKKDLDICATEKISEAPYYQPSKSGYEECHSTCSRLNVSYVKILNKSVCRLSEHIFSKTTYVKLHPINANVSDCVHNKQKNTYDCKCKSNYQITIDRDFYTTVRKFLNGENIVTAENLKIVDDVFPQEFAIGLFFLKFLPRTAPLYIALLFELCGVRRIENDRCATYPDPPFVSPNVEGTVEKRDLFGNIHDQLFKKIFETIAFEDLNIYNLSALLKQIQYKVRKKMISH